MQKVRSENRARCRSVERARRQQVTDEDVQRRILLYMDRHPEGVPAAQMTAWLRSIRKFETNIQNIERALYKLRDDGKLACANKVWYARRTQSSR